KLKEHLLSTFIQGSHRRSTAIKGSTANPCDVDIVAVTNLSRSKRTAAEAHRLFQPFLERYYSGQYEAQDRSWCIAINAEVKLDLVPTSEPGSPELLEQFRKSLSDWTPNPTSVKSTAGRTLTESVLEAAKRDRDWDKTEPLWIPDRKLLVWEQTHPLFLIAWTARKNLECNGHFGHVVKVIKWWRRHMKPTPKYPKGYPLEHLIGDCCPDGIKTVAEGVTRTFETIASTFATAAWQRKTPFLAARGVTNPEVNVMSRVDGEDFAKFHAHVADAAELAREALEAQDVTTSAQLWHKLLGNPFPKPPGGDSDDEPRFTPPKGPARPQEERFA
ncbi:MAG: hypothetical protein F6K03_05695, partial [Kamptonema sp. SIO4C4]|nr:hypothetical protein [Kamptonema sp. SIO4C4]